MSESKEAAPPSRWRAVAAIAFSIAITLGVLAFADQIERFKEWGYFGLFLISLFGSATIIFPAPAFVSVFAMGNVLNPILVGIVSGVAAGIGELTGYLAGYGGAAPVTDKPIYRRFQAWMDQYGPWAVFVLSFIPNPLFDIAGILAGASRMPWWQFVAAAALGKVFRFILLAFAGYYGIDWVRQVFGS